MASGIFVFGSRVSAWLCRYAVIESYSKSKVYVRFGKVPRVSAYARQDASVPSSNPTFLIVTHRRLLSSFIYINRPRPFFMENSLEYHQSSKFLIYQEYRHLKTVYSELLDELELVLAISRLHFKNYHQITRRERYCLFIRQKADSLILTVSAEILTRNVNGKNDRRKPQAVVYLDHT